MTISVGAANLLPNMLPKGLVDRFGLETIIKLSKVVRKCHRARNRKCPKCHSRQGTLRITERVIVCRKCKTVYPIPGRFG